MALHSGNHEFCPGKPQLAAEPVPQSVRRQGLVGMCAMFSSIALASYGDGAYFLPGNQYWRHLLIPSVLAVIAMSIVYYRVFSWSFAYNRAEALLSSDRRIRWMRYEPVRAFCAVMIALFIYPALHYGVPAAASYIAPAQETKLLVALAPDARSGDGGFCTWKIKVRHPTYGNTAICDLFKKVPRSARAGDQIELTGRESYFGFRYHDIRVIE